MNRMYFYKDTPVGDIAIAESEGFITHLLFSTEAEMSEMSEIIGKNYFVGETPLIKQAKKQLDEYFQGIRTNFVIPLKPSGTAFQVKVWEALQEIPNGETRSYKEIAQQIGNPKASRAVGNANNKNPISIIIPCHRVIGANGELVGYGGGLDIKERLLALERENGKK